MTEAIQMKCRYIALLAILAAVIIALPAAAAEKQRIGARLVLFPTAPATFTANQPFHIAHGWLITPDLAGQNAVGKYDFALEVDGQLVEPDFVERESTDGQLRRSWVNNFPAGLPAGTHVFTATWSGPCQGPVDSGLHTGTCAKPTEVVVLAPLWQAVDFMPLRWDPVRTRLRSPGESNPSPDSYGSPPSGATGAAAASARPGDVRPAASIFGARRQQGGVERPWVLELDRWANRFRPGDPHALLGWT